MALTTFHHQGDYYPDYSDPARYGNAPSTGTPQVNENGLGPILGGTLGQDPFGPTEDKIDAILQQLYGEGKIGQQEALDALDAWRTGGLEQFKSALQESSGLEKGAIDQLDAYLRSDEQAPIDYGEYVGDVTSQGALATADQRSRDAQYAALDKLEGMTTTQLTPEEEFIKAKLRAEEERDQRAARQAALRDMEARGVRSGAGEMASVLGAQGITSQNRMLGDLGALANASERARLATEQYGNLAGDISEQTFGEKFKTGTQADYVEQSNKDRRQNYQREKQRFLLDQQGQRFDQRDRLTGRRVDFAGHQADKAGAVAGAEFDTTGRKIDILTGENPTERALKLMLAKEEERRAEEKMKPDSGGLFDHVIGGLGF